MYGSFLDALLGRREVIPRLADLLKAQRSYYIFVQTTLSLRTEISYYLNVWDIRNF